MSKKIVRILFPVIAFCSIAFFSCKEDEECRQERYVRLYAGFYYVSINTSTEVETVTKLTLTDSLSVQGIGAEGFLYTNVARKDTLTLSLNKLADVSEFVFTFKDTSNVLISDTISIYYENHEDYLSFECGCLYTFTIDSLLTKTTNHYIDSISINSKEVNTANVENIKIYHTPK